MFRRIFLVALLALAGAPLLRAETPTVTAVLTSSETEVDRPVQLQIKVTGDSSATPPNDITVDGLEIRYTGQSQLVEGRNFHFSYSFIYNYTILPLKAGTFTIPPQTVRTTDGEMRTPSLTLNVAPNDDGSTTTRRGGSSNSAIDERKLAFAELIVPKTSAYVGEIVPVEIRLGFKTRFQLAEGPNLGGQGFTTQRMPQPKQTMESINGRSYQVFTFKTAIAAARSGQFEVGPAEAKAIVQVPQRAGGNRSPYDLFGMNDPFSDPFFNDPFGGMMEQRQIEIKSRSVQLEVMPLPAHAPASFAGAVGNFSLTSAVKPKTAQVGDPLTVTAAISGRGNFDRVTAPSLEDDRGWHTYPPSAKFAPDDDVGLSGTKSFEMVISPNERKSAVPPLLFSYFDPIKGSYETLKSEHLPIVVEGGTAPSATPALAGAASPPAVAAQPTPSADAEDILYQLTDRPRWVQSFAPVFTRPVFWAVQGLPFLGLIGFFGWKARQRRLANREGLRRAAWEHETAELQKKLRHAKDPPDEYFAGALRVVQLKTALARRLEPNTVDAETAVSAFQLSDEKRERVRELFRRSDELRYSGRQNGHGPVTEETRREVLDLIESLS